MAVTYRSFATGEGTVGAAAVITKPTGTTNGDLLVAFAANYNPGNAFTAPAGWTLVVGPNTADAIYYRVASGEGANYTWTTAALSGGKVTIVRLDGQAASSPVASSSVLAYGNRTSFVIPTQTVPAGSGYSLFQCCVGGGSATFTPPGSATERFDATTTAGGDETVGSGATGTRTWTASSAINGAGFMVAIAPLAATSPGKGFLAIL